MQQPSTPRHLHSQGRQFHPLVHFLDHSTCRACDIRRRPVVLAQNDRETSLEVLLEPRNVRVVRPSKSINALVRVPNDKYRAWWELDHRHPCRRSLLEGGGGGGSGGRRGTPSSLARVLSLTSSPGKLEDQIVLRAICVLPLVYEHVSILATDCSEYVWVLSEKREGRREGGIYTMRTRFGKAPE